MRSHTLDTLRTLASLLVILLHVSAEYVSAGINRDTYESSYWIGNVVNSFSRICVPIFVLISGRFLIGRNETIKQFYSKRASRLLIPLVFWSIIYFIYSAFLSYTLNHSFDIILIIKKTVLGKPFYHMWYLFMLIGLYLVTPIINSSISKVSRKNLWTASILLLIFGMINSAYDLVVGNRPFFILWFFNYLGYFILGFLIKDYTINISNRFLFALYLICGITISVFSYLTALHFNNTYFYGFLSPFVIFASISIYMLFQQFNLKNNYLSRISHLTLGIYLIHAGILSIFRLGLHKLDIHILDNPIIGIPVKFLVTFFISLLLAYIYCNSKYLKKTI